MKIGIHTCSYTDTFNDDPTTKFENLENAGIEVVEFSILDDYSISRAKHLRKELAKYNLQGACCTAIPENADIGSLDAEEKTRGIKYLKNCIRFCSEIDTNNLSGVLYAPWGKFDSRISKEEKWLRTAESFEIVCAYAAKQGVQLNLEILNRFETDYLNTVEEGLKLLSMLKINNLKLLIDAFHMNIEEENNYLDIIKNNIDRIGNVHVSKNNRGFPSTEDTKISELVLALLESGYEGNVIMECCAKAGTEVSNTFNQWRDLLKDRDLFEVIQNSSRFLKSSLNKGGLE